MLLLGHKLTLSIRYKHESCRTVCLWNKTICSI